MEINQEARNIMANAIVSLAEHLSRGDLDLMRSFKELLSEGVIALGEHLEDIGYPPNIDQPKPLDVPPPVG